MRRITYKRRNTALVYNSVDEMFTDAMKHSKINGIKADIEALQGKYLIEASWSDHCITLFFSGNLVFTIFIMQNTKISWSLKYEESEYTIEPKNEAMEIDWGTSTSIFDPYRLIMTRAGAKIYDLFYNGSELFIYFESHDILMLNPHNNCLETKRSFIYVSETT